MESASSITSISSGEESAFAPALWSTTSSAQTDSFE